MVGVYRALTMTSQTADRTGQHGRPAVIPPGEASFKSSRQLADQYVENRCPIPVGS